MYPKNNTSEKIDVYQRVTNQIVAALESAGAWKMPWHTSAKYSASPINTTSRKAYRGINTLCLWASAQEKGYEIGEWGTYQQWQDRGCQVRKGEKSTMVVFWKFADATSEKESDDAGETSTDGRSRLMFARAYNVFNAHQVDGYTMPAETVSTEERIADADAFFSNVPAAVNHFGNRAFYSRASDAITLPKFSAFFTAQDYYSTRAHETAHWTGCESRCNRTMGKRFGDEAYAMEELVAELSAAFTMAHLGLSSAPREDHAAYLANWLKVLKADKHAIFTAASKAQQATDFILAADVASVEAIAA